MLKDSFDMKLMFSRITENSDKKKDNFECSPQILYSSVFINKLCLHF